jgi:hypothetical protein
MTGPMRIARPTRHQRGSREAAAIVRTQPIPWDRHRQIKRKFCTIVGGMISPPLANRVLDEPDRELERRGHRFVRYADDVRHITWRWIPFAERRGLEEMTLGPAAYPMVKVKGDSSMPSKRERSEDAYGPVPQGPCDMVRTGLFEPQPPAMQAYIPRHSVSCRGHRDRATKSSSPEPSTRWAMGRRPIQGSGRGTYVALDTSSTKGMWDRPPRREAQGDGAAIVLRGRESRPHGEGRQVSRNSGGEVREMRNAETVLGIIRESDVPHVPRRHPCRTAGTGCFDRGLGRHWKAGCSERRTPGLGRGG